MATTRVFVRGLPPSVSEDDFRDHFAKHYAVTDIKLLSQRRIGYVGFRTNEDAAAAVKYFNRSFLRMSKIGVELVDNDRLKTHRGLPTSRASSANEPSSATFNLLKRKRQTADVSSAARTKAPTRTSESSTTTAAIPPQTPSTVITGLPHRSGGGISEDAKEEPEPVVPPTHEAAEAEKAGDGLRNEEVKPLNDKDWIRSRTSRLLGLVDEEDENHATTNVRDDPDNTPDDDSKASPAQAAQQPTPPLKHNDEDVDENDDAPVDTSDEANEVQLDQVRNSRRLFLRNLPYTATEGDLLKPFEAFGTIQEVHLPLDARSGQSKGIAFIQFSLAEQAVEAFSGLDGTVFQGRLLHVLPAAAKRDTRLDEFAISKLPVKKQRQIQRKAEASSSTFNWNALYMNTDAVMSSVSERLGVSKSELIDPTSSDAAVKQAQAETHVIQETKAYFEKHGVDLNAFSNLQRGDTTILVKNFTYGTTQDDLTALFGQYGELAKTLLPPTGTIAIVEFKHSSEARAAFNSLAYRKFKDSVLFLEKAPKDLFKEMPVSEKRSERNADAPQSTADSATQRADEPLNTSTLFVRNLNFATTNERFYETFKPLEGLISARIKTKTDAKRPGQVLSMGFGFLEFQSKDQAKAALSAMDGYDLDGYRLLIRASHKGNDAAHERQNEDRDRKNKAKKSKIIIKNLPFEVSKKDIRDLFKSYGQLRAVRVPKKFDNTRKGYAFAEFTTPREAESAMDALRNTHLLGRRLVLDFAAGDAEDPEAELEKMQQKVGKQSNSMALRKLTASSERKKFVTDDDDGQGE